jgi:hypothetical protein
VIDFVNSIALGAAIGGYVGALFDRPTKSPWRTVVPDVIVGATSAILANWIITSHLKGALAENSTVLEPRLADGFVQFVSFHSTVASLCCAAAVCVIWRVCRSALRPRLARHGDQLAPDRTQNPGGPPTEPLPVGGERGFKAAGLFAILTGLVVLAAASFMGRHQWQIVSQWPRTNGTLIDKEVSGMEARLLFRYEARGKTVLGSWLRWGSPKSLAAWLDTCTLGTSQTISYNPENPSEAVGDVGYNLELFGLPLWTAGIGALLVVGGLLVRRTSLWRSLPKGKMGPR